MQGLDIDLQEVLDDLVRNDIAHIVSIRQLGEGNSSNLGLLQVCKSRPSTVTCTVATCFQQGKKPSRVHLLCEHRTETANSHGKE